MGSTGKYSRLNEDYDELIYSYELLMDQLYG